ncbi:unnamed protein product [Vicia faba]|uniref:DUF223 domain-containing protein n=1 Tax=Vicia faba TaxID=3906 RepID=A0AAV1A0G3_VICFA|nr:unnamed protein product [Vicia faba]
MAHPVEAVKDINDSKDLWKIAVRCKHLWTVTSASNKEHLEMILVDSKLDIEKNELSDIPLNYFNILGLDAIVDGKFESNLLVDIIGGVTKITQSQIIVDNNKRKVVFTLTDLRYVECTLISAVQCTFN